MPVIKPRSSRGGYYAIQPPRARPDASLQIQDVLNDGDYIRIYNPTTGESKLILASSFALNVTYFGLEDGSTFGLEDGSSFIL